MSDLLPSNPDLEKAVLGACMNWPDLIADVRKALPSDAFWLTMHQNLYHAILHCHDRDLPVNRHALAQYLTAKGKIEEVGGAVAVVSEAKEEIATPANVNYHVNLLRGYYVRRQIVMRAEQIRAQALDVTADVDEVLLGASQIDEDLATSQGVAVPLKDALNAAADRITWAYEHKGELAGFPTGIRKLDAMLSGLERGNYIVIGARPSEGKTALGLEIARRASEKTPVLIVSREMPAVSLAQRLISRESGVNSQVMRSGHMSEDAWERVGKGILSAGERTILIDDKSLTACDVRASVRENVKRHGVGVVIVDYLQMLGDIRGEKYGGREEAVTARSRLMKRIALENDVAMVVLAQLNRQVEGRGERRPRLSDLRESGAIEQDADVVLLLYHPNKGEDGDVASVEILVEKQRNGPTGMINTAFNKHTGEFREVTLREE